MKLTLPLILAGFFIVSLVVKPTPEEEKFTALQSRGGLPYFFTKVKAGKPVTIAYLGGSITEAPGYRVQTESYFKSTYPASTINTVNAGVGGTGSYLGVFRLQQDVLNHHPDLVFVEFAVNDGKADSLKTCNAVEGIIRQIKRANRQTDICFLYTIYEPMIADYRSGVLPSSIRYMERIASHYNIPSINLGPGVLAMLQKDSLVFKANKDVAPNGKIMFSNDGVHPTTEGHTVYTRTIVTAMKQIEKMHAKHQKVPSPLYAGNLQHTVMLSPKSFALHGNWQQGTSLPELKSFSKSFPDLVYTSNPKDSLVINFRGNQIGFGDVIGPSSATALIKVDGKTITRKRFDEFSTYYRRSFFFVDSLKNGPHTLSIKLDTAQLEKMKILRPGNQGELSRYNRNELYIGNIMLVRK